MHDLDGPDSFFVVDFFCHRFNLIIEVDGGYHSQNEEADTWRDFQLSQLGYHTLRFSNELVLNNIEQVLAEITTFLECPINRQPPPL